MFKWTILTHICNCLLWTQSKKKSVTFFNRARKKPYPFQFMSRSGVAPFGAKCERARKKDIFHGLSCGSFPLFHKSFPLFHIESKSFPHFSKSFPHLPKSSLGGHREGFSSTPFSGKPFRFTDVVFRGASVLPNGIVRHWLSANATESVLTARWRVSLLRWSNCPSKRKRGLKSPSRRF